jgi:hypothetical protein
MLLCCRSVQHRQAAPSLARCRLGSGVMQCMPVGIWVVPFCCAACRYCNTHRMGGKSSTAHTGGNTTSSSSRRRRPADTLGRERLGDWVLPIRSAVACCGGAGGTGSASSTHRSAILRSSKGRHIEEAPPPPKPDLLATNSMLAGMQCDERPAPVGCHVELRWPRLLQLALHLAALEEPLLKC